jgi:N-acetylmuramoyl-L-alanine amidase
VTVRATATFIAILLLLLASLPLAQGTAPASPLILITRDARRTLPTTMLSGQELVALDDLASLFQLAVREDTLAGGITVSYRGRTIVASTDQPMASVSGRIIALPAPATRAGRRWLVPLDFIPRALGPIYDQRIDLRRTSRLLIVGDLRVPRVSARIDAPGPPTRATIEISPAAPVAVTVDGGRVFARIEADALDLSLPAGGGGLIEQVRAGDQPNTVAVVLSGRAGAARAVASEADNLGRISIEVPSNAPAPDVATAPPPPAPPADPAPSPVLTATRPALQTLVIDAGHGGEDIGARGADGVQEKQITLDVARRLRTLIETRLGIRVVLTRDDDRAVSLDERAAVANNSKADLFLSLHVNAAPASSIAGAEVYHVRLDREGEDARRSADTEGISLPVLGGATRSIDIIRWDLAQARHVESSAMFAGILEENLRAHVTMGPRPLQAAPLRVLTGVDMPAALIEMGFLTNDDQEEQVRSENYQNTIAQAMYDAIFRFRAYLEGQRAP